MLLGGKGEKVWRKESVSRGKRVGGSHPAATKWGGILNPLVFKSFLSRIVRKRR